MRVLAGFYDCALLFCYYLYNSREGDGNKLSGRFLLLLHVKTESLTFNSKVPFAVEETVSVCFPDSAGLRFYNSEILCLGF